MMRHLLCCLLLALTSIQAHADERILTYHSDIQVQSDGSMMVTETIQVRSEVNKIKRGIYRDFPTTYKDKLGNRYTVGFELHGVMRDGNLEPHHIKKLSNGVRIYAGDKNTFLKPGVYTYSFSYRTTRQLGFFEQHDELYWNVTGNDWDFPINQASAWVRLPVGIQSKDIVLEGYTGAYQSKAQDYSAHVDQGISKFFTTRPLRHKEGLSIVVSWPKGHVTEPGLEEDIAFLLSDNRQLLVGLVALLVLLAYYLFAWLKVGRDPDAGTIVTLYEPPKNFSPASMRYISKMSHDDSCFSSALINLAVKGYLHISEDDDEFTLTKLQAEPEAEMAPGEKALFKELFDHRDQIILKQSNHKTIKAAKQAHEESLSNNYERVYFNTNSGWMLPGLLITLVMLALIILQMPKGDAQEVTLFMTIWLSFWSMGTFALVLGVVNAWRAAVHNGFAGIGSALFMTAFSIPFVGGLCMGVWMLAENASWSTVILLGLALSINFLFYILLRAPTLAGRRLLDKVEGFKDYLQVAESDELSFRHPAGKTVETFERFLPFALALGVEQLWAEEFSEVLSKSLVGNGEHYHPSWYSGHHWNINNPSSFTQTLGSSLSSSIASSSTAPGSSSGGGGGGSSGGGGGGGGGGGW